MKPKYRLTKLEKLQMFRLMWLWLAEDWRRSKHEWHDKYRELVGHVMQGCFLCDLFYDHSSPSHSPECSSCPLYVLSGGFCEDCGPYYHLVQGDYNYENDRAYLCRRIAHCADHLIAELEAKQ